MGSISRSPSPEFSPLALGEDLVPLPKYKAARNTNMDFSGLLPKPLRLHEDLTNGCGGQLWPAGMVLAKHILRYHRDDLHRSRILELGAGGGLVGLAVASGCDIEKHVIISDQAEMFHLMEQNIAMNKLDGRVKASVLNWGEPLTQEILDFKPDVILAADCVYFEPAFPLLLATLSDLLHLCPSGTIFFCFKKRRHADMRFLRQAMKAFLVTEIHDEDRPVFSRDNLFLYSFKSKTHSCDQPLESVLA